jgi:Arc/MetJ family transcription regulator
VNFRGGFVGGLSKDCAFAQVFAPFAASNDDIMRAPQWSPELRTTVTLDDDLLAKATKMMGGLDRSTVLREGLKALIERESALRLAKLGGTQPQLQPVPRRRAAAAT